MAQIVNFYVDLFQLSITPKARSSDEPIVVHYDMRLTLKIEGVVKVSSHASRALHQVRAIELHVHSTQQSRSPTLNGDNTTAVHVLALTLELASLLMYS